MSTRIGDVRSEHAASPVRTCGTRAVGGLGTALLVASLTLGGASVASANDPSQDATAGPPTVELVVRGPEAALAVTALTTSAALEQRALPSLGGVAIEVPAAAVRGLTEQLADAVGVESVHPSVPFTLASVTTPNDPQYARQWLHPRVGNDRGWTATTGSDAITIAIIDTGVDADHPDLRGRVLPGRDVTASGRLGSVDADGHGTAVAVVAAAAGDDEVGVAGGCWSCLVLPVNVAREGRIHSADVAEGVIWATDQGADIINISLGGGHDPLVAEAVARAASRGVLVVASAGNWPDSGMARERATYPARYPTVLGVEASDHRDRLYHFSHHGTGVGVAAPGCDRSPDAPDGWFCGTSASAPAVSGIAALALATGHVARAADLLDLVPATAVRRPTLTAGRIDALALLRQVTPCARDGVHLTSGSFADGGGERVACFDPSDGRWHVDETTDDAGPTTTWGHFATRHGWQSHLVGDVTRDGRDDVLSYHPGTGNWILSRSTGRAFRTSIWTSFATRSGWTQHLSGPVTSDGATDVLSYHPRTGNWVLTSEARGSVDSRVLTRYGTRSGWDDHLLGDVTGDGRADLLGYHPGTGNWVLTAADGGERSIFTSYRTREGWDTHLLGDVTGDGRADLLSFHPGTGNWVLTPGDGGRRSTFARYRTTSGWSRHLLEDVTGDGRADLVSHHLAAGSIVVTPNRGASSVWARPATSHVEVIGTTAGAGDEARGLLTRDGAALLTLRSSGGRFVTR